MTHTKKCPPEANPRGEKTGEDLGSIVADASAEQLNRVVQGTFVVVVFLPSERVRRRVFLALASAQRHADLARARGHRARVVLAKLEPVTEVSP